jgi:hypothetical protein
MVSKCLFAPVLSGHFDRFFQHSIIQYCLKIRLLGRPTPIDH